ncbi:hypothetical protein D3C74_37790 [compost metagenome]
MTDANGLYHMRARYYSPDIKRFINRDVVTGTISDIPTLNRYAYVNGNPVICFLRGGFGNMVTAMNRLKRPPSKLKCSLSSVQTKKHVARFIGPTHLQRLPV